MEKTGKDGKDGKDGQDGSAGPTGNGIASITKTGTSGLIDTYTITYTDGNTTTYEVKNGEKGDTGPAGQDRTKWTRPDKMGKMDILQFVEQIIGQHKI